MIRNAKQERFRDQFAWMHDPMFEIICDKLSDSDLQNLHAEVQEKYRNDTLDFIRVISTIRNPKIPMNFIMDIENILSSMGDQTDVRDR
jgi:hypothetical protein